jgi:hypothetical protein
MLTSETAAGSGDDRDFPVEADIGHVRVSLR